MDNNLKTFLTVFSTSVPYAPLGSEPQSALKLAHDTFEVIPEGQVLLPEQIDQLARQVNDFAAHPGSTYLQRKWLVEFAAAIRGLATPVEAPIVA